MSCGVRKDDRVIRKTTIRTIHRGFYGQDNGVKSVQLEQVGKAIYKTRVDNKDILLFMTEKLMKSNNIHESLSGLARMLEEYKVIGEIALLPDLTPASSLPIGSSVTIESEKHINPNFLGMDAGCG